jgi:hypothetical protein
MAHSSAVKLTSAGALSMRQGYFKILPVNQVVHWRKGITTSVMVAGEPKLARD